MKRHCVKCEAEYELTAFSFDSGFCDHCKPGFFSAPLWLQPCPAGTRDLWKSTAVIHAVLLVLSGMLLDCGEISIPGGAYSSTVLIYLTIRFAIAKLKGYPVMSRPQAVAMLLLPAYGPALFIFLFHVGQKLRYGS